MATQDFTFDVDEDDFMEALDTLKNMSEAVDEKYMKSTLRRKVKPIENSMQRGAPSDRLPQYIGVTQSKKKTKGGLVKVGVIKNDPNEFPEISSYALASILEYGTEERYRPVKKAGIVVGKASTGKMPKRKYAWLRRSWDSKIDSVSEDTVSTVVKRIEKKAKQ